MHAYFQRSSLVAFLVVSTAAACVCCVDRSSSPTIAAEPAADGRVHDDARPKLDPAAWGSDHVGEPLPEYVDGGECLFCHRNDVGGTWSKNRHEQTIHDVPADSPSIAALQELPNGSTLVGQVELLLGDTRANRFLRRSAAFGKLDMLTPVAVHGRGRRFHLTHAEQPTWDETIFAQRCAGCHTTGVDPDTLAFVTPSLDCYVCHGDADVEHANDPKLMPLAKARNDSPAVITSICAQCHVRFGKSKSTGLPFPNNFVAGDNLFRDFEVDWSLVDDLRMNPADRHVLDNVREVVLFGNEQMTCLTCHEVHPGTTIRHRQLADQAYCQHCHEPGQDKKLHKAYDVHSERCGY